MPLPKPTDEQIKRVVDIWLECGCNKDLASRKSGIPQTTIKNWLDFAVRKKFIPSSSPDGFFEATASNHTARQHITVENGTVFIGSDAHYWPGSISTAHKVFVKMIKRFQPSAVIMNGDVTDCSTISRFPPIGWEKRPKLSDEIGACQDRLREIKNAAPKAKRIWTIGNHDCFDDKTECLTKRGWLKYNEILRNDEVLSLDGDRCVWTGITDIVQYPYEGELVRIEKMNMSMAVTPNHRVLLNRMRYRTLKYDLREYRKANDLPCSFTLPVSSYISNSEYPLNDDQLRLAGWMLTDGGYSKYGANIYQSKEINFPKIESILNNLKIPFRVKNRQRNITAICGKQLKKQPLPDRTYFINAEFCRLIKTWIPERGSIPAWGKLLSNRQFGVLLESIVDGDGVWDGDVKAKKCAVIYKALPFLESLQSISVLHGWRSRIHKDPRGNHRLCLCKHPSLRTERKDVFNEYYSGVVWCLKVPLTNFMVRRRGCAYFSGNCRYESRLAMSVPEYSNIRGMALKDHFPDWDTCWSVWINNDVVVKHRYKGGIHATHNNVVYAGKTIVTGHLHSLKVTPFNDYNPHTRYGVDCGTLAKVSEPDGRFSDYCEDGPVNWRSGFAILTFVNKELLWPELVHVLDDKRYEFRGKVYRT